MQMAPPEHWVRGRLKTREMGALFIEGGSVSISNPQNSLRKIVVILKNMRTKLSVNTVSLFLIKY